MDPSGRSYSSFTPAGLWTRPRHTLGRWYGPYLLEWRYDIDSDQWVLAFAALYLDTVRPSGAILSFARYIYFPELYIYAVDVPRLRLGIALSLARQRAAGSESGSSSYEWEEARVPSDEPWGAAPSRGADRSSPY